MSPDQVATKVNKAAEIDPDGAADSKKKIVVVVLLAILLIAILLRPDNDPATANASLPLAINPEAVEQETSSPESERQQTMEQQADSEKEAEAGLLQRRELSRLGLEPLLTSTAFATVTATKKKADQPAAPRRPVAVKAIYGAGPRKSALVDDSIVRPGEPLPDGRRVIDVTPEGVAIAE